VRFIILLASAVAWLVTWTLVGLATDSWIAGVLTATALLVLFVLIRWQGFSSLLERARNSNLLDERPAVEERERTTGTGLPK
jgi:hypothetical protein